MDFNIFLRFVGRERLALSIFMFTTIDRLKNNQSQFLNAKVLEEMVIGDQAICLAKRNDICHLNFVPQISPLMWHANLEAHCAIFHLHHLVKITFYFRGRWLCLALDLVFIVHYFLLLFFTHRFAKCNILQSCFCFIFQWKLYRG